MSDQVVEQITMDPPTTKNKDSKNKEKDPKKVAAGKKLAEHNKKAREALAREMKREKEQEEENKNTEETKNTENTKAWIPELSFTTVLSIVGIGFTAVDMFMRYYKNRIVDLPQIPPPTNISVPQPPPTHTNTQPSLKIGML